MEKNSYGADVWQIPPPHRPTVDAYLRPLAEAGAVAMTMSKTRRVGSHSQYPVPFAAEGLSPAYLSRLRSAKVMLRSGIAIEEVRAVHGSIVVRDARKVIEQEQGVFDVQNSTSA